MDGAASDFSRALGDCIGHRKNLVTMFIEHQMMVSEVHARHMPVKVFGLEVERKNVGQQYSEGAADVTDCVCADIGRSCERGISTLQCRAHLYASILGAAVPWKTLSAA